MNNKLAITGYHLLLILSSVDGENDPSEREVIKSFLLQQFPLEIDPIEEAVFLDTISRGNFDEVFDSSAKEFLKHSTPDQRTKLLDFAERVINADRTITDEEKHYYRKLRGFWKVGAEQAV